MNRREFSRRGLALGLGPLAGSQAAALCAAKGCGTRELPYAELRRVLQKNDVYFES